MTGNDKSGGSENSALGIIGDGLYPASKCLLDNARIKALVCRVDIHEEAGDADLLWLEYIPGDSSYEGEYIAIEEDEGGCAIRHNAAHKFGGHPTSWSYSGDETDAVSAVVSYLLAPPSPSEPDGLSALELPGKAARWYVGLEGDRVTACLVPDASRREVAAFKRDMERTGRSFGRKICPPGHNPFGPTAK